MLGCTALLHPFGQLATGHSFGHRRTRVGRNTSSHPSVEHPWHLLHKNRCTQSPWPAARWLPLPLACIVRPFISTCRCCPMAAAERKIHFGAPPGRHIRGKRQDIMHKGLHSPPNHLKQPPSAAILLSGRRRPGGARNCTSGSSVADAFGVSQTAQQTLPNQGQPRLPGAALRCCRRPHRPASRGCRESRRPSCRRRPCGCRPRRCPSRGSRGWRR